jgi:hypothetical protein
MDAVAKIKAVRSLYKMVNILRCLGISDEGLATMDEMKDKVIQEIEASQRQAMWSPGQASDIMFYKYRDPVIHFT